MSTGGYDTQWGFLIHVILIKERGDCGVHGLVKKVRVWPIDRSREALAGCGGFGLSVNRLFFIRSTLRQIKWQPVVAVHRHRGCVWLGVFYHHRCRWLQVAATLEVVVVADCGNFERFGLRRLGV